MSPEDLEAPKEKQEFLEPQTQGMSMSGNKPSWKWQQETQGTARCREGVHHLDACDLDARDRGHESVGWRLLGLMPQLVESTTNKKNTYTNKYLDALSCVMNICSSIMN